MGVAPILFLYYYTLKLIYRYPLSKLAENKGFFLVISMVGM